MPDVGTAVLRESQWARLSDALGEQMGLYYPRERWGDLERGVNSAARMFGKSVDACVDWLLSRPLSRQQIEVLASCLTVGETYFFRERRSFEVLRSEILPTLLRTRRSERRLRIWSAGCCTGEEPYSIAMLLASTIPDLRDWNVSILATDIDPNFLRKATTGIYNRWSFRDTPPDVQQRYFKPLDDGRFEIAPRIRDLVTFAYLNLAEDSFPSVANGTNAMDIVFCRNVLMYFELTHAARVLQRLGWSLLEGGWLFINPVEIPHGELPQLEPIQFGDVIVHRKSGAAIAHEGASGVPKRVVSEPVAMTGPATVIVAPTPAIPDPVALYALPTLGAVAANEPTRQTPDSLRRTATEEYAAGRYAQTVQAALDLLSTTPDDVTAMVLLAKSYANQGRLAQAQQCCEQAVAIDRLNPEWRYLLATILQELGELDRAADELRRAIFLDPDRPLAHFSLGNLLRRQGLHAEARRYFRNALALLEKHAPEELVPQSEGLTSGRLADILRGTLAQGVTDEAH